MTFRPEADGTSFEVALASIVSKYLRELFMHEFNEYWKLSVLWGYPRLEIWGMPRQGIYNPKRWTRIGPRLDGMPITQSLWLEHAKRFKEPLDMR